MPEQDEVPHFLKLPFAPGVALFYAVAALLWIYFSDRFILLLAQDQEQLLLYSTFKGWGYVLLTAGLLFLVLHRFVARISASQRQLRYSSESYSTILDRVDAAIYIADFDTRELLFVNEHLRNIIGDDVEGKPCWQVLQNEAKPCSFCNNSELLDAQGNPTGVIRSEFQNTLDERWYDIRDQAITWVDGRLVRLEIAVDITERKELEQQLLQAQKLESIGRLAGGVAHDYNNMLGVILGSAELALKQIEDAHPVHAKLEQIRSAARRSADITRQLLAFARKQTIAPQVIDLNESLEGMLKMLRRLIGEDIELTWLPATHLDSIEIDPVQLDQLLANLCVNARDAISGSGKITIETANVEFDAAYCKRHQGFNPGHYVMLAVSDSGCGMDKETQAHIYEPFFTTKESGKGTGLGLATVYGIVKQNQGFINLYSEPGSGTTFRIYLSRHTQGAAAELATPQHPALSGGHGEQILVVEDEPTMLELTSMMLEELGYEPLKANEPREALELAKHNPGISLLLTDVVMPGMNGRELAKQLQAQQPRLQNLKILYMSGYTANVIAHHGVLEKGVNFIQKPFSLQDLALKMASVM